MGYHLAAALPVDAEPDAWLANLGLTAVRGQNRG